MDFETLGALAQQRIGWKMFTANRNLPETSEVERVYTTDAAAYPLAGRKLKRGTEWSRQVLERGEPYFSADAADIRAAFDDAEKILGLGLGAIINIPVKRAGRVVGTLNFMREAGGYRPEQVAEALALAEGAEKLFP